MGHQNNYAYCRNSRQHSIKEQRFVFCEACCWHVNLYFLLSIKCMLTQFWLARSFVVEFLPRLLHPRRYAYEQCKKQTPFGIGAIKKNCRAIIDRVQIWAKIVLAQDHCFGYFELAFWSLPPIFGGRTNIYLSKVLSYQLWGLGIKKFDAKPIFTVLESKWPNLALLQKHEN